MFAADAHRRSDALPTATPLFAGLDAPAIDDLLACARTRRYAAGELICQEGEPSDRVLVLARGHAEVFVPLVTDSRATSIVCLHPGDVVGEIGVVTDRPRSASVIARSDASALEITRDDFLRLLARHPRLQANLIQVLGDDSPRRTSACGTVTRARSWPSSPAPVAPRPRGP